MEYMTLARFQELWEQALKESGYKPPVKPLYVDTITNEMVEALLKASKGDFSEFDKIDKMLETKNMTKTIPTKTLGEAIDDIIASLIRANLSDSPASFSAFDVTKRLRADINSEAYRVDGLKDDVVYPQYVDHDTVREYIHDLWIDGLLDRRLSSNDAFYLYSPTDASTFEKSDALPIVSKSAYGEVVDAIDQKIYVYLSNCRDDFDPTLKHIQSACKTKGLSVREIAKRIKSIFPTINIYAAHPKDPYNQWCVGISE